ncbi:MAG: polysaccharide deacetylase family protein [Mogibacterium sp.]|nr:polysaccharide deacetylase family protein [Mogibacterium sp.]
MGKTERQGKRGSWGNFILIAVGILILAVAAVGVIVVPRYGRVFAEYRKYSAELRESKKELADAQKKNTELLAARDELQALDAEVQSLQAETFSYAAELEKAITNGGSNKRICYITIDDGPYYRGRKFLEIFNKYDVKATFFLTTANGDMLPDHGDISASSMYPEYLKYGHTIGNHTYSHNYGAGGIYSSAESFMKSIRKQDEFTEKATGGYEPVIVRFPGGTGTAGSELGGMIEGLRKEGHGWIDWTIDSSDSWGTGNTSPKIIMKQIKKAAKDQKIMVILFHEWSENSQKAMPQVIEYLTEQNYIFLPLFYDSMMVEK